MNLDCVCDFCVEAHRTLIHMKHSPILPAIQRFKLSMCNNHGQCCVFPVFCLRVLQVFFQRLGMDYQRLHLHCQSPVTQPLPLPPSAVNPSCTTSPANLLSHHLLPFHLKKISKFLLSVSPVSVFTLGS